MRGIEGREVGNTSCWLRLLLTHLILSGEAAKHTLITPARMVHVPNTRLNNGPAATEKKKVLSLSLSHTHTHTY